MYHELAHDILNLDDLDSKTWNEEITKFCPGINKGKIFTEKEINKIITEDKENEKKMLDELN